MLGNGHVRFGRRAAETDQSKDRHRAAARPHTEIPTDEGKLYQATVIDLYSRKLLACPIGAHPDADLVCDAIKIAAAVRGSKDNIEGVIFHWDRGSTYTAGKFTRLCVRLGIRQSMGRVGSCFDSAAAESFFSTLEHEVLSRYHFATKEQAREVVGPGAGSSTTSPDGTAPPHCSHPTTTRR